MAAEEHGRRVSVVGLGYVGLPVALAFGRQGRTVGFDVDTRRVLELRNGRDRRGEVTPRELSEADIDLTCDASDLEQADFHIVAVPTPIDSSRQPDLSPLLSAAKVVGSQLKAGDIVVFESTVYPGATEEDCVPVLETTSGLSCGKDFHVGYSPERINPGDPEHSFEKIVKVVSGQDEATLDVVARVYGSVVTAGVHRAPTIRVAEAAKVIENTQRDLNIALMNELSLIFRRLGVDTHDVLEAAGTKWNFLSFTPGLVGGHCIGVDPYYLTHKAEKADYYPEVILAGRRINDGMGRYIASELVKAMVRRGRTHPGTSEPEGDVVTVLGVTFKPDVSDTRNSRVPDIVRELEQYGIRVQVCDLLADPDEVVAACGIRPMEMEALEPASAVVLATAHRSYVEQGWSLIRRLLRNETGIVVDVPARLSRKDRPAGVHLWRL